ncbi:hypothetical protein GCM10010363_59850 [Streptomyces omiyaensis]|uniref:DUF6397 family protein n=1 Tax=Streptomyces omiyaensis TaxID=68247 RepID=UPI0019BF0A47|nr:DUF6397 family protein [Streptomyces omiyaensis]GGY70660.1 hypothetical protein GCM10010363_59850 [Streptomyces omiyaensis]
MTVDDRAGTTGAARTAPSGPAVAPARAAEELGLRREDFRLAVLMGLIRTVPVPAPVADADREDVLRGPLRIRDRSGRARAPERRPVERAELERLKAAPDFPAGLRDRVRTVGAGEAAELLSVTHGRFTRLARTGHLSPVRFSVNRYRSVIWRYVAAEVTAFGADRPDLLTGRLPAELRERADTADLRARNWRTRHLGLLLRAEDDPWIRAAAIASLLDPVQLAEVVDDPYERLHLDRLRPAPPPGLPLAGAARELADRLVRADDPDEVLWHRVSLALALDEAREAGSAPYPGERARARTPEPMAARAAPEPQPPVPGPKPGPKPGPVVPVPVRVGAVRGPGEPPVGPVTPAPMGPRRGRSTRPPGPAARTRRAGLLERLRRSLPGRSAGAGRGERWGWG